MTFEKGMNLELIYSYTEMNLLVTFEKGNESRNDIFKHRNEPGDKI